MKGDAAADNSRANFQIADSDQVALKRSVEAVVLDVDASAGVLYELVFGAATHGPARKHIAVFIITGRAGYAVLGQTVGIR